MISIRAAVTMAVLAALAAAAQAVFIAIALA